jgi:hypothetical protein
MQPPRTGCAGMAPPTGPLGAGGGVGLTDTAVVVKPAGVPHPTTSTSAPAAPNMATMVLPLWFPTALNCTG